MHGVPKLLVAAALTSLGLAGAALAAEPMSLKQYMALQGPAPTAHVAYGQAPQQYVEFFEPTGSGPFPVAVLIHGGCFQNDFEGMPQFRGMAGALAARGIAVWSIEYRGVDRLGGGYPGTWLDVRDALDLLVAQAPSRHLDLQRLVLVGHSAGAVLGLWAAGRAKLPTASPLYEAHPLTIPQVLAVGSIADLPAASARIWQAKCDVSLSQLTGLPTAERPDVDADTSPFALTPNGSATLFINGDHDTIAPPKPSADYAARVRERGDVAETLVLPDASHFDEVAVTSPSWALVEPAILKALGVHPASPGK